MSARSWTRFGMIGMTMMALAAGCVEDDASQTDEFGVVGGEVDEDGKPSLDGSGWVGEGGKEDAAQGRLGLSSTVDSASTQVWEVKNQWADKDTAAAKKAGMSWGEDSGLTWEQKYRKWIGSFKKVDRAGSYGKTYEMPTPWGHSAPSPALECAESSMFLRITFASWYNLPFFMEAVDGSGKRVYFGHFGVRTVDGRYGKTPEYKAVYKDHTALAAKIASGEAQWPVDSTLAGRKIPGSYDDSQPAIGPDAHAGAYFDTIFLNKRVGYYLMLHLTYFGSVSMADPANTYNIKAEAVAPGDSLVERWQKTGIGHVLIVMRSQELGVKETPDGPLPQIEAELASGSMPRRQPVWESPASSKRTFTIDETGGVGYVDFGGGIKRWRSPVKVSGRWSNMILPADRDAFIPTTDKATLSARPERFEAILAELSPAQKLAALTEAIEAKRMHLLQYPASCSARIGREQLFASLYELLEADGTPRAEIDQEHRKIEDYVFAELEYDKSKTCCWNSTNAQMAEIILAANEAHMADGAPECKAPLVFMNRFDGGDGYKVFADFATSIGRGAEWRAWRADESCPQSALPEATLAVQQATPWCELN
jgi:hypothetical protein